MLFVIICYNILYNCSIYKKILYLHTFFEVLFVFNGNRSDCNIKNKFIQNIQRLLSNDCNQIDFGKTKKNSYIIKRRLSYACS